MLVETKARIGVFAIALGAYLPQFPGLVPEFQGQYEVFKKRIPGTVELIDGGIVTTKEQAWKKMAELMKEGYALPFDYGVGSIKRQIYRTLRGNKMVFTTVQDDMKEFATPV